MATQNTIAENIKAQRARLGFSQERLAQESGVKYTTLTKIESGVIRNPSVLVIWKIAKILKISVDKLVEE